MLLITLKVFSGVIFATGTLKWIRIQIEPKKDNQVIAFAFTVLIKMLHLYVPFVTEALWKEFKQPKMLAVSEWPQPLPYKFKASHQRIEIVKESISQIRALREKQT